jgi:hypothetical protein
MVGEKTESAKENMRCLSSYENNKGITTNIERRPEFHPTKRELSSLLLAAGIFRADEVGWPLFSPFPCLEMDGQHNQEGCPDSGTETPSSGRFYGNLRKQPGTESLRYPETQHADTCFLASGPACISYN